MLGPGDQRHRAIRLKANIDILRRITARALDVIGKAKSAQFSLRLAELAPRRKAGDVGRRQGTLESIGERAAVDLVADRIGHRHRRRRHQVLAAQFDPVEAALPSRRIDQPLDDIVRLCVTGAAQHANRRGVGKHPSHRQVDRRDAIDRAGQECVLKGLHGGGAAGEIGAEIGFALDPQRQKLALGVERQRRLGALVAALMVGEEDLAARRDPFDRAADTLRRPR